MEVIDFSAEKNVSDQAVFEPTAHVSGQLSDSFDDTTVVSGEVTFHPGERTKFHTHDGVQVLYVVEGEGMVATRDHQETVSAGNAVLIPRQEEHWHGSGKDAEDSFTHVYFIAKTRGSEETNLEPPEL